MLETKNMDSNYLCKIVKLEGVRKHSNADRLQVVNVGMNTVITSLDAKDGDIYVYFPLECKISESFLSATNSFRNSTKNADLNSVGFFEDNCRVKAVSLRGERSMGYIVPASIVVNWALGKPLTNQVYIPDCDYNMTFDTINGQLLVDKYQVKVRFSNNQFRGKQPKLNRLVDGQVNLHGKTKNLRHTPESIQPNDLISITYKTHGTSWWVSNVLVKRRLNLLEKFLKYIGVAIKYLEYDIIYGSRNVVKNKVFKDPKQSNHFYGVDIWSEIRDEIGHLVPKGFTLYGECLGFTSTGEFIQKGFDYGCDPQGSGTKPQRKIEVYRITQTNEDGDVTELSYPEIKEFCEVRGLTPSHLFFYGKAGDLYKKPANTGLKIWSNNFVTILEREYNQKDCFMCDLIVPEEGVVIRKERLTGLESYKLKSYRFLEGETKAFDMGESDIESEN